MGLRRRSDQIICISTEADYGDANKVLEAVNDGTVSFDINKSYVEMPVKSGSAMPKITQRRIGRKAPTITINSPLYPSLVTLLSDYLNLDHDTDTFDDLPSYTIWQLTPSLATAGDGIEAVGCKPETINLTQNEGIWMAEITFACKDITLEKAVTGLSSIDITDRPSELPLRYDLDGNVAKIKNDYTTPLDQELDLEDLSITLTFERADENKIYRNSQTKIDDLICSIAGEIMITYTWDDENPMEADILDDDGLTFEFKLSQLVGGLDISYKFQRTNFDKPDDTTCVYSATITGSLVDEVSIEASTSTPA